MKNENELTEINNKRVDTTKLRVAHAIKLIDNPISCLDENRVLNDAKTDIAHALNLLESGVQEMRWACEYNDWDDRICDLIDDACMKLGICLANLIDSDAKEFEPALVACYGKEALAMLSKALATLERWFDDSVNTSEV